VTFVTTTECSYDASTSTVEYGGVCGWLKYICVHIVRGGNNQRIF